MQRWVLASLLFLPAAASAATAADVSRAIRELTYDKEECYRVRDLSLAVEDIRIFFGEGHLLFSKPVAGRRIAAVFAADTDQGEGEVMLLPPDRAERQSLARYTDSPNLDEHITAAVLFFTGDVYDRLKAQIDASPGSKKDPDAAEALVSQWEPSLRRMGESYDVRLTLDLLGGANSRAGLFAGMFQSSRLGAFEMAFDPRSYEQILAGKLASRQNRIYFDVWTNFVARSMRNHPSGPLFDISVSDYRIQAAIAPDLSLSATTRFKMKALVDGLAVVPFGIAQRMQASRATIDGRPAEVLQHDASRPSATLGSDLVLIVPPEPLRQGREYEVEIQHAGRVIIDAGEQVYYVSARGDWYPTHGLQYANYDFEFRYPAGLDLVTPGDIVEDRVEGAERITRRRTSAPIRLAGFNLGNYEHARVSRGPYEVDVCANRALEPALVPKPAPPLPPVIRPRGRGQDLPEPSAEIAPTPSPLDRLHDIASDVASALEFMASKFGPPALPRLTVSPIPGAFGQGFPGLIYLSTMSYLKSPAGPQPQSAVLDLFIQDVLQAHEVAHQWWGNRVSSAGYRDAWLQEALAGYSALLYLEQRKGPEATELILGSYRRSLLAKNESGQTVESLGPIVLGERLISSVEPRAWNSITYGKGAWIMHMLRTRMGTDRFFSMLAEVMKRYDHQQLSTDQFRQVASEFLPPKSEDPKLESFFDQWVYGTGVPNLMLAYSVKGKAPVIQLVGTLTQSDVDADFSAPVPVEIQLDGAPPVIHLVNSATGEVTFTVALKQAPLKVTLDPHYSVLRQ